MVRYLLAAVVGCLYVAGSVWIVRSQGQSYRSGLTRTKPAVREVDRATPSLTEEKQKAIPPVAASDLDSDGAPATSRPAPAPVADAPPKPAADHSTPAPPVPELAKMTPASSPHEKHATARPAGNSVPVNPLANNAFWNQPQLTRVWDVAHLKLDDERRLRDELHELIVHFNPLVEDQSTWLSRLDDAAEPFLKRLRREGIRYKFFILDSDVVNAFAIPGGNVYISRGLLDLIGEDEDYALQFAIGHEMAHVDLEHAIKCLRDPGVMKMTEGTLQKLFLLILPYGYLRADAFDQEFEADEWVSNRMQPFRTRREILVFLQKLEGYSKKHGFYGGEVKPQVGRDLSPLENHYRAQTAAWKRLKHLKAIMEQPAKAAQ